MKILYITFEKPSKFYGGGICCAQSLMSLANYGEIDYIGLPFEQDIDGLPDIGKKYFLKKYKNPFAVFVNMLRGLPSFYYNEWKKIIKKINPDEYDLVYAEFSHHDFVAQWAKKNGLKVATRVHNIEWDMHLSVKRSKKFSHYKLRALLNGKSIFKREKKNMLLSDALIFLTAADLARAENLYGTKIAENSFIVPICVNIKALSAAENPINKKYVLATGSLGYGPNAEGIVWFLNNVWSEVCKNSVFADIYFVAAGSNPSEEIKNLCRSLPRCILIENPPDIGIYFDFAEFYVAPIFTGAGMKVKVAEALLHGLRVVGTPHALTGYEPASTYTRSAENAREFIEGMLATASAVTGGDRENCRNMALENYSIDESIKKYGELIQRLKKA